MLRRLVLAPLLALVALATVPAPASADDGYDVLCVDAYVVVATLLSRDIPGDGGVPKVCVPLIVPLPDPL